MKPAERYGLILSITQKMVQEKTLSQIKLFFHVCQIPQDETLPSSGKANYVETVLRDSSDKQIQLIATELGLSEDDSGKVSSERTVTSVPTISMPPVYPSEVNLLKGHEYDAALSFAGEDRAAAKELADLLLESGWRVFYDEYEKGQLWGKDLYTHLSDVYSNKSKFCVMFLSKHYAQKVWTNHERKAAQERAFHENLDYILPLRLDDTRIPGVLDTIGYLDLRYNTIQEVCELLIEKLQQIS